LDKALAKNDSADTALDRARALAVRAELAVAMGDAEGGQAARAALQTIQPSDEGRQRFRDELQAEEELERWPGDGSMTIGVAKKSWHCGHAAGILVDYLP